MADIKISDLSAGGTITGAETIPVVQSSSTVKITVQDILDEVPVAASQSDSTATDVAGVVVDLNALLAKLKAAGSMS